MSDLDSDRKGSIALHRYAREPYRKKRYTSIDAEGKLRVLHSKGEKCKSCKNSGTPVGEAPCLKCLAGNGFPNYTPKNGEKKPEVKKTEEKS